MAKSKIGQQCALILFEQHVLHLGRKRAREHAVREVLRVHELIVIQELLLGRRHRWEDVQVVRERWRRVLPKHVLQLLGGMHSDE